MRTKTEELTPVEHHCHCHHTRRISWSAILVGALVAVGLAFLLNIFGIAIGLSAFSVGADGASVIAMGGLIGIVIGVIVTMMVAGYAAGYLGRTYCPQRNLGIVYGFTTWCIALLLSAAVTAHVTSYVTTYANTISNSTIVVSSVPNTTTAKVTTKTNAEGTQKAAKITTTPHTLAWGAFSVFVLFFIGAFSSCVGACWGMHCCRED